MRRWLRLDAGFDENVKVATLSAEGFRAYVRGLCYCARNLTDGAIPATVVLQIGKRAATSELLGAGLWEQNGSGVLVHDYLEWQEGRDEVESLQQKRSDAGAKGARRRWRGG